MRWHQRSRLFDIPLLGLLGRQLSRHMERPSGHKRSPQPLLMAQPSSATGTNAAGPAADDRVDPKGNARLSNSTTPMHLPRLVKRNLPFHQSHNRVSVGHAWDSRIIGLHRHDWFHKLMRWPSWRSFALFWVIWTAIVLVFGGLYILYDNFNDASVCHMGTSDGTPIKWGAAFAFSLETCTTVGYALASNNNFFFEECPTIQFLIYLQQVWSMLFNAFLFAFLYNRLGVVEARGVQVVFAKNCIISMVNGQWRFQVRVYDVDARHPVVEAHVRLYAVLKAKPVPRPLRVLQPNDELGGMLFLSMPGVVCHHIDLYSVLHPPRLLPVAAAGLTLRQVDSMTCNREDVGCPICGETFGTHERWIKHVQNERIVEEKEDYPKIGTHLELAEEQLKAPLPVTMDELKAYIRDEISEIICLVEGIDPLLSGTFQALQSYTIDEMVFGVDAQFMPCLKATHKRVWVDLDNFHEIDHKVARGKPADVKHNSFSFRKQRSLRVHDSLLDDSY